MEHSPTPLGVARPPEIVQGHASKTLDPASIEVRTQLFPE
jgi:hypothetical protein